MWKKTYDSNNLHLQGGTWCSQILCDRSCSLRLPSDGPVNSFQREPGSPSETGSILAASGNVMGTKFMWAVVRCGFWITDRVGELQSPPPTSWEIVQGMINDKHTHTHATHTRHAHGMFTMKQWVQKQYLYNYNWIKIPTSNINFRIPKRLHITSHMRFEPKPRVAKIFINIPFFPYMEQTQ